MQQKKMPKNQIKIKIKPMTPLCVYDSCITRDGRNSELFLQSDIVLVDDCE